MTDDNSQGPAVPPLASPADVDRALDQLIAAVRAHLEAVRAAEGERDDDAVWAAYVRLNNASREYDEVLNAAYGEVTPWDLEEISPDEHPDALLTLTPADTGAAADDPYPRVVSVRQRRDYRIPSVSALLRAAEENRQAPADEETQEPITDVADAILELLHAGDGSLAMLDVPELEPLDGVVVVAEVETPLGADSALDSEEALDYGGDRPFRLSGSDRLLARLDERSLPDPESWSEPE